MEEKRTIFDYLAQMLTIFGFAMLVMNIFCIAFGDSAKSVSEMFALGGQGIPTAIAFQFLCVSALIVGARFVFFTDILIKKMSVRLRTVGLLITIIAIIAAFIVVFHWFPADRWEPWAMFFVCFGISFLGSCFVMVIKERVENKRMEEALRRLKAKEESIK